ncbi:hypothetical protein AB1Y20_023194 [Prymnesium parvum]|uniref:Dolichol phosphate-mannose biosynthesis regulatory protein n=1 Tax=Prymnesium parvum TaxID=97485 RepID=A0AB34JG93_PRYPA
MDRVLGAVGFSAAVSIYVYYTAWVLLTPFVDPSVSWFHNLFPDRWWAIAVPTTLFVVALAFVATFVATVSLTSK